MHGGRVMHLVIKKGGITFNEFRFVKGPIYIGRHMHSQIFLPERAVSRQHAVIYITQDGQWVVEDLDSANKTFLNEKPIHKASIQDGDVLKIADFSIEIHLMETLEKEEKPIDLADTLTSSVHDIQVIVKKFGTEHAPSLKVPSKRIKHFAQATDSICSAKNVDQIASGLITIMLRQFYAFNCWCSLRSKPDGAILTQKGKTQSGKGVQLSQIYLKDRISEAMEKKRFLLFPRLPLELEHQKVRSAMIAPLLATSGCFGVMYVDNSTNHEHYDTGDLDYLILIAVYVAAIMKNM
jgi:pSer/pThr/pTyr-binding forkhead associated (FHA) protein